MRPPRLHVEFVSALVLRGNRVFLSVVPRASLMVFLGRTSKMLVPFQWQRARTFKVWSRRLSFEGCRWPEDEDHVNACDGIWNLEFGIWAGPKFQILNSKFHHPGPHPPVSPFTGRPGTRGENTTVAHPQDAGHNHLLRSK